MQYQNINKDSSLKLQDSLTFRSFYTNAYKMVAISKQYLLSNGEKDWDTYA